MLYYSKVVETKYIYHEHHDLPFNLTVYMLFCPFVVAQHVSEELEENISPADIEAVEEWAYTVRVKVKGHWCQLKLPAIGNRGYTNKVRLRGLKRRAGLLKPAQAGFACIAAVSTAGRLRDTA